MQRWIEALEGRELKEVMFCRHYAQTYAHGTSGHSRMMIIAKLADMLDEWVSLMPQSEAKTENRMPKLTTKQTVGPMPR